MCENKNPKIMVIEVKSEESSPTLEPVTTVSPSASSAEEMPVNEGCKNLITGDTQDIWKRKANLGEHLYPKKVTNMLFLLSVEALRNFN